MSRTTALSIAYAVLASIAIVVIQQWWIQRQEVETLAYSEFDALVQAGKVKDVYVTERQIRGSLKEPLPDGRRFFVTTRVEPALSGPLAARGVKVTGVVENTLLRDVLSWIVPVLFFGAMWLFLFVASPIARAWVASCRSARARRRSIWKRTSRSRSPTWPASTRPRTS
jgi:cell division protease FtsH